MLPNYDKGPESFGFGGAGLTANRKLGHSPGLSRKRAFYAAEACTEVPTCLRGRVGLGRFRVYGLGFRGLGFRASVFKFRVTAKPTTAS